MILGPKHKKLEERITKALLSGISYPREAYFLHQMSERLLRWGRDTPLSPRQMARLTAILSRCEHGHQAVPLTKPPQTHPHAQDSQQRSQASIDHDREDDFGIEYAMAMRSKDETRLSMLTSPGYWTSSEPSSLAPPVPPAPFSTNPLPAPTSQRAFIRRARPIKPEVKLEDISEAEISEVIQQSLAKSEARRQRSTGNWLGLHRGTNKR